MLTLGGSSMTLPVRRWAGPAGGPWETEGVGMESPGMSLRVLGPGPSLLKNTYTLHTHLVFVFFELLFLRQGLAKLVAQASLKLNPLASVSSAGINWPPRSHSILLAFIYTNSNLIKPMMSQQWIKCKRWTISNVDAETQPQFAVPAEIN